MTARDPALDRNPLSPHRRQGEITTLLRAWERPATRPPATA
jgi:hypothetical protein